MRLAPQNPDISNNYAIYLCQNGRTDEGVRRFLDAARNPLYRTPEAAYTNAGVCLRNAKHSMRRKRISSARCRSRPNFAEAAFQLGDLQFERGRLNDARQQVEQYLAVLRCHGRPAAARRAYRSRARRPAGRREICAPAARRVPGLAADARDSGAQPQSRLKPWQRKRAVNPAPASAPGCGPAVSSTGMTLLQAAEKLHIDSRMLEALEEERFDTLGAPVFIRGHLRNYADLVGEHFTELQQLFDASSRSPAPDLTRAPRAPRPFDRRKLLKPAFFAILGIVLICALWVLIRRGH